eukprot:scaffold1916_cov123-Isochrysis_galbana.AAC.9
MVSAFKQVVKPEKSKIGFTLVMRCAVRESRSSAASGKRTLAHDVSLRACAPAPLRTMLVLTYLRSTTHTHTTSTNNYFFE